MPKPSASAVAIALEAFQRNAASLKIAQGVADDTELWRMVGKRSRFNPSQKTVNNALKVRHDAKISTLESIAEAFNVPLWVMFIPDLTEDDLKSPRKERLVALLQDYLKCKDTDRMHVENMASAFAAKPAK